METISALLARISYHPDSLFPAAQGWGALRLGEGSSSLLQSGVLLSDGAHAVFFFPLCCQRPGEDAAAGFKHLRKSLSELHRSALQSPLDTIAIIDEAQAEQGLAYLERHGLEYALLLVGEQVLRFARGDFLDPHLSLRLKKSHHQVPFEGGVLSLHGSAPLHYNQMRVIMTKVYALLNAYRLQEENKVGFAELLQAIILDWDILGKQRRQQIFLGVHSCFVGVLERHADLPYRLKGDHRAGMFAVSIAGICEQKQMGMAELIRKQQGSLSYLNASVLRIPFD